LQDNYDNLNSGDILVVRYYYEEYYKDYIYILRQESPMAYKTWHLLTVYDTGATSGGNSTAGVTQEYFSDEAILDVVNNKDYHAETDISNLVVTIPSGECLCSITFKIIDSGDFNIGIMGCNGYIGKAPDFKNGETWELNIHNGIIASGKVVSE
jgi:hypothetical protein